MAWFQPTLHPLWMNVQEEGGPYDMTLYFRTSALHFLLNDK